LKGDRGVNILKTIQAHQLSVTDMMVDIINNLQSLAVSDRVLIEGEEKVRDATGGYGILAVKHIAEEIKTCRDVFPFYFHH
jgi:hypothetical protein